MKKNLIIACAGDDSLHLPWFSEFMNYDLCIIYYGNNSEISEKFKKNCNYFFQNKGEKYHLIKKLIDNNSINFNTYEYIWLPDVDIEISVESINKLFEYAKKFKLSLCQPSMNGFISHQITAQHSSNLLRYTSFVEILAPLFDFKTFMDLKDTFDCNYTSHGLDFVWPKLMGYPDDKIAIIDDILMTHTKPIGQSYERFIVHPHIDFVDTMNKFNLDTKNVMLVTYDNIKNN